MLCAATRSVGAVREQVWGEKAPTAIALLLITWLNAKWAT
jgi:hypothetical protein